MPLLAVVKPPGATPPELRCVLCGASSARAILLYPETPRVDARGRIDTPTVCLACIVEDRALRSTLDPGRSCYLVLPRTVPGRESDETVTVLEH